MGNLTRRDVNHKDIRDALVRAGRPVYDASFAGRGLPDLIAEHRDGHLVLLEIKRDKRATLTEAESHVASLFRDYVIVTTVDEALAACGLL